MCCIQSHPSTRPSGGFRICTCDGELKAEVRNAADLAAVSWIDPALRNKILAFDNLTDREFLIVCTDQGFYRGRSFRLRASSPYERDLWQESVCLLSQCSGASRAPVSAARRLQTRCRRVYEGPACELATSALILSSFAITMAETQLLPEDGTAADAVFGLLGEALNWVFALELLLNVLCKFLLDFLRDPWNWFDASVVLSRFLLASFPNGAQTLRCVRAVRVFRLLRRVPALLRLVRALATSVPKVLNAFALVVILISIYSILAVQFFADTPGEDDCAAMGTCPWELFGYFSAAFFTMFQISTLDAWSDVTRSLMRTTGQPALVAAFFASFLLIVTYTLLQVPPPI
jgi:hypothetical protein